MNDAKREPGVPAAGRGRRRLGQPAARVAWRPRRPDKWRRCPMGASRLKRTAPRAVGEYRGRR